MNETKSDEWYALLKKGDDNLERKYAYNRSMMGLLDGQKAQTAQEQATMITGGGTRSVSLDANNEAVYTGQTKPGINNLSSMIGYRGQTNQSRQTILGDLGWIEHEISQKLDEIVQGDGMDEVDKARLSFELKKLENEKKDTIFKQTLLAGITLNDYQDRQLKGIEEDINILKDNYANNPDMDYDDYQKELFSLESEKTKYSPNGSFLPQDFPIEEDWEQYVVFQNGFGKNSANVNAEFLRRLAYMAKQEGIILEIGSGYRTNSAQKKLDENGNLAAPAGKSWHEYGLAVDCKKNAGFLRNLPKGTLEKYGLTRRAVVDGKWEWWHITPLDVYPNGDSVPGSDRKNWALENAYYNGIDVGFGG